MATRLLTPQKILNLAADPAYGDPGDLYYHYPSHGFKYNNGSGWVSIGTADAIAHGALTGLTDSNAHPASSISVNTSTFNGFLTSSETDVQLALNKLDDLTAMTTDTDQSITGTKTFTKLVTNYAETQSFIIQLTSTSNTQIDSFNNTTHRSAQYFLQYTQGSQVINTAVLVIHNGTDAAVTEYGTIKLVTDLQVAVYADISSPFVRLFATSLQASAGNPVDIKFIRNLIKV